MSNNSSAFSSNDLLGLYAAKKAVQGIIASDSSVHAVLLFGEEGAGKSELANLLTRFWLCEAPSPSGACGECRACMASLKGVSSDFHPIFPRGASNWIHVAAIREVADPPPEYVDVLPLSLHLRTAPIRSRCKVVWIDAADRLYEEASNSLLKTLEEPPDYARLILTTSQIGRIRPTIRSRCLTIPCELPTEADWRAAHPNLAIWEEALSRRSPGRLARLRRQAETYQALFELGREAMSAPLAGALAMAQRFRDLADAIAKGEEINARRAGAQALQTFGAAMAHFGAPSPSIARIIDSHRRTAGNVNPALEFDALFSSVLAENRGKPEALAGVSA